MPFLASLLRRHVKRAILNTAAFALCCLAHGRRELGNACFHTPQHCQDPGAEALETTSDQSLL